MLYYNYMAGLATLPLTFWKFYKDKSVCAPYWRNALIRLGLTLTLGSVGFLTARGIIWALTPHAEKGVNVLEEDKDILGEDDE